MPNQALSQRYAESPLTALVRRASSKRSKPTPYQQQAPVISFDNDVNQAYRGQQHPQPPPSPLLHGQFSRDSVATYGSNNPYLDNSVHGGTRVHSYNSHNAAVVTDPYQYDYADAYEASAYEDRESVYSQPDRESAALRESWLSTATAAAAPQRQNSTERTPDMRLDPNYGGQYNEHRWNTAALHQPATDAVSIAPSLVVSPESAGASAPNANLRHSVPGRQKVLANAPTNFSRPLSRPPVPSAEMEEAKRQVLLRNQSRRKTRDSPRKTPPPRGEAELDGPLPNPFDDAVGVQEERPRSGHQYHEGASGSHRQQAQATVSSLPVPPPMSSASHLRHPPASQSSLSPHSAAQGAYSHLDDPERITSIYSNYSYYPYEAPAPSPTASMFSNKADPFAAPNAPPQATGSTPLKSPLSQQPSTSSAQLLQVPSRNPSNASQKSDPGGGGGGGPGSSASAGGVPTNPQTPHDYLLLGIDHHEHDRLEESAVCFERSARENGGCGVGMLMWGLALRHGWGCAKNEKSAFKWLQRAAESAVEDLEATRANGIKDNSVVRSELVLAIYEVGQCFFQGWGVPKDQKMAVSYYTIAAELGDADAQMDLAFCLTNGKGCKKDKRAAAKWYREAVKQGQSDVGLAWIYKDKYK